MGTACTVEKEKEDAYKEYPLVLVVMITRSSQH